MSDMHGHRAQLSALISALCKENPVRPSVSPAKKVYKLRVGSKEIEESLYDCPARYRDLDLLLVSIGGNDVAFSRIIEGVTLEESFKDILDVAADVTGKDSSFKPRYPDDEGFNLDIDRLRANYGQLADAMTSGVGVTKESGKIFLTAYPFMAYESDKDICPDTQLGMTVSPIFAIDHERALAAECGIEGGRCADTVPGPKITATGLTEIQRSAAKERNWVFSDGVRTSDTFKRHGLCAYSDEERERNSALGNVYFPRRGEGGHFTPFRPSEYKHYASRTRWFRTPNDTYLGARSEDWKNAKPPVEKFAQWVAYFGAFHPTAEGQAYMADMLFKDVTAWLKKSP